MTSQENQQSPPSSQENTNQFGQPVSVGSNLPNLLPVSEDAGGAALAQWANEQPNFFTTLPVSTPEDKEQVLKLMASSDKKSKNCVGGTLAVVGFAVDHGALGESEEGEIIEGIRGFILLDDGTSVFTTSRSILKFLKSCVTVYGRGLWMPPILVEIREVKSKRGDALIAIPHGRKGVAAKGGRK